MDYFLNVSLIILYDSNKRYLLQHRTEDAPRLPGYWAFFGGGIKKGEDAEQAVYRETFEELNYCLTNPKLIFQQNFEIGKQFGFMNVFIESFIGNKTILRLQEGQDLGWFNVKETLQLKMVHHDRVVISVVENLLKKGF